MTPRNTEYTKYDPPGVQVSNDALAQKYLLYTPPARPTGIFLQKLVTINKVKRPELSIMAYLYPISPSIYVHGEKQESSKLAKMEKLDTGESRVCSWATP